jgi:hypothetical protein
LSAERVITPFAMPNSIFMAALVGLSCASMHAGAARAQIKSVRIG